MKKLSAGHRGKVLRRYSFIGLVVASTTTQALELDYQHQYSEVEREHKDKVMLTQALDNGLAFSFEAVMATAPDSDGGPGKAFSRLTKDELKAKVKYSHKLGAQWKLKPKFTYADGKDKKSYKPSLKVSYALTDKFSITPGYYHKLTRYDETGKADKHDDAVELGAKYKFGLLSVGVGRKQIYSNQIVFDGTRKNYSNKLLLEYKLTKRLTPYLEVADVYVDKDTDQRQARYRVGFSYEF
ncbi:porin [Pseudomonas sp. MUP55]|uniref:porin n=1 Tax=Pseudomonas sp. MUP55 TaxID=3087234 RepID=UPI002A5B0179|nr:MULTISPECIES: porin [unclassified Pseudomonas]WPN94443.1 porin [Pseudomonas sp. MUP56]WPN99969.1 porin [Pseudomonas sp. MUP55]